MFCSPMHQAFPSSKSSSVLRRFFFFFFFFFASSQLTRLDATDKKWMEIFWSGQRRKTFQLDLVTVVILEKRCQRIDCLKGKEQERQPPRGHTDREGRGNWNIHNHMGVKFRGGKFYCLDRLKRNSSNRVSQHGEGKATPALFSALCHYQTICQKRRLRLILFTALLISDSSQWVLYSNPVLLRVSGHS